MKKNNAKRQAKKLKKQVKAVKSSKNQPINKPNTVNYKKIAELKEKGFPTRYIAKILGVTSRQVTGVYETKKYKAYLAEIKKTIAERRMAICEALTKAIERQVETGLLEVSKIKKTDKYGNKAYELVRTTKRALSTKALLDIEKVSALTLATDIFTKEDEEEEIKKMHEHLKTATGV